MYIPRIHQNEDQEEIKKFVQQNGFGILVTSSDNQILATHIPMELEVKNDHWWLQGHVSRANPHWKHFESNSEVLAIFQGPHAYISSSWYSHINVPTWNYVAVHLSGKISMLRDHELSKSLGKLVEKYEQSSSKPFTLESMPEKDFKKQVSGIVGFEIKITKIEGKKKLSQNRNETDFQNVIENLENKADRSAQAIAKEMRSLKKKSKKIK